MTQEKRMGPVEENPQTSTEYPPSTRQHARHTQRLEPQSLSSQALELVVEIGHTHEDSNINIKQYAISALKIRVVQMIRIQMPEEQ